MWSLVSTHAAMTVLMSPLENDFRTLTSSFNILSIALWYVKQSYFPGNICSTKDYNNTWFLNSTYFKESNIFFGSNSCSSTSRDVVCILHCIRSNAFDPMAWFQIILIIHTGENLHQYLLYNSCDEWSIRKINIGCSLAWVWTMK